MTGVVAAACFGLGIVGVVAGELDGDAARLERAEPLELRRGDGAPDQHGEPHPMADGGGRDRDPMVAAACGHQRGLGPFLGHDRHLVMGATRLERAGRLDLLPLQPHVGRAGRLGQLATRFQRGVERDPAQPRTCGIHITEGGHARHAVECRRCAGCARRAVRRFAPERN